MKAKIKQESYYARLPRHLRSYMVRKGKLEKFKRNDTNINWTGDRDEFIAEFLAGKSKEEILAFLKLNPERAKAKLPPESGFDLFKLLNVVKVPFMHVFQICKNLLKGNTNIHSDFFDALPSERNFARKKAIEVGKGLGLSSRTIDNHLSDLVKKGRLKKPKHGHYFKS